jgi:acyl-coenzyme A synthetase/AMP-(fatty) acid ligase
MSIELVDNTGRTIPNGGGFLVISKPWPGMLRTI